jgi:hypothetical protein
MPLLDIVHERFATASPSLADDDPQSMRLTCPHNEPAELHVEDVHGASCDQPNGQK